MITNDPKEHPLRVGLISLGCAKNLVDAELMLGSLLRDGIEIINEAARADALIVNTCSFIDSAQEESVDAILEAAQLRDGRNREQAIIVSGCLPQRFREELPRLLPEVDAFIGIDQVTQIPQIVRQAMARRAARLKAGRKEQSAGQAGGLAKAGLQGRKKTRSPGPSEDLNNGRAPMARSKLPPAHEDSRPAVSEPALDLLNVSRRPTFIPDYDTPRFRLTPGHFAYIKIAEGCNHPCSFCTIPRMRGSHRSRRQSDIVTEAKALIADGVKELNLISQDSTYYGLDLRPEPNRAISSPKKFGEAVRGMAAASTTICTLLRELNTIPGDFWIRLLYTHPAHWTDNLIQTLAECPKVARYVDIPLQHIHGNMLERMRRETSREYILDLLKRIRAGVPGIALRTTFIVGFPGETEEYFQTLLEFIRETKFERLGVFTYSREAGTRAGAMAGHVPDAVKHRRRALAMAAQRQVAEQHCRSWIGRVVKVLAEGAARPRDLRAATIRSWEHGLLRDGESQVTRHNSRTYSVARGEADAPDIDGRVYVRGRLAVGEFSRVRIVGHTDYDLLAVPE